MLVGLLDDPTLKGTETRLAAEMGATSETLSRTLAKLRDRELLRVKGNTLTLKGRAVYKNCCSKTLVNYRRARVYGVTCNTSAAPIITARMLCSRASSERR